MTALSIAWSAHRSTLALLLLLACLAGAYAALLLWRKPRPVVEPYLARLTKGLEKGERE